MSSAFIPRVPHSACVAEVFAGQRCREPVLFEGLEREAQEALVKYLVDDRAVPPEWTDEETVLLHWRLLEELRGLEDPETPLEEKIDALRWVLSEPRFENAPFSFSRCVKVVCSSPLAPIPYCGPADPESVREWFRNRVRRWFLATIAQYPSWVREEILTHPQWVQRRLEKNPQWLNERIKECEAQGDLFVSADGARDVRAITKGMSDGHVPE